MILIGANDVTHTVLPSHSVRQLVRGRTPPARRRRRRSSSAPAPTSAPSSRSRPRSSRSPGPGRAGWPPPRPSRWSRRAAARSRSARSSGPEFAAAPALLFGPDQFHPSADGYRSLVTVLLPSTLAALGLAPDDEAQPEAFRGEGVLPIVTAAVQAVNNPGTELDGTEVGGLAARRARAVGGAPAPPPPPAGRGRGARRDGRGRRGPRTRRLGRAAPMTKAPGRGPGLVSGERISPAEDREQPQQVGVDPDQADGHRERRAPRLPLGDLVGDALLHEVEVHDQHEDAEHEAGDREEHAQGAEAEQAELAAEHAEHHLEQAQRRLT